MSQKRGLGDPPMTAWRLDLASLQASAHRTSHNGLEIDAMCCTSQGGGVKVDPSQLLSQKSQTRSLRRRAHAPAYHDFSGTVTPRGAAVQMQALMSSLQKVQLHIQAGASFLLNYSKDFYLRPIHYEFMMKK